MTTSKREISPRRLMSVVAEDDEDFEEHIAKTRSPRIAKASLQEGADGPTVKTSLLGKSPTKNNPNRPSKHASWKTSKFFSKTMTSGELLRGLKKLTSSGEDFEVRSQNDSKPLKTRLGSLKKKSIREDESLIAEAKFSDLDIEGVKKEKGIVCKKDDILSIIANVSQAPDSPNMKRMPLRYTRSASLDPGFAESSHHFGCSSPLLSEEDKDVKETTKLTESPEVSSREDAEPNVIDDDDDDDNDDNEDQEKIKEEVDSKVQWDDGNFVDAMLLGGAIEAFLKGSMGTGSVEKRVSFKKT
ncbi:uncharacterized protein [Centruroides vittatus]|uniref:uncharacterized protein n=1 Tax=Centruroides vittatus TaxID=120091 RepID=UPI003510AAA6